MSDGKLGKLDRPDLHIDVEVYGGAHIPHAIEQMVALANRLQIGVWAKLNGVRVGAHPGDDAAKLAERWDAALASGREWA